MKPDELDALGTDQLVERMDEILASPYWNRRNNSILKLYVGSLYKTSTVLQLKPDFQRKLVYKTFGFLLQLQYTQLSSGASFFHLPEHDGKDATQIYWAARNQWTAISSRIAFEYFMHLTYMLGTGRDFESSKSAIKAYINWLKTPENPYTYFTISVARAMHYDRRRRSPEVHATTKYARQILLGKADSIDNEVFQLMNIITNQWQFIIEIANNKSPSGWAAPGNLEGDKDWYKVWESGNHDEISKKIDEVFFNHTE